MIGLLGATGEIGRYVAQYLDRLDAGPVEAASRSTGVDAFDDRCLDRFATGCRLVINCCGPAHLIGDRVARAAARAGAAYVDPSGEELLERGASRVKGLGNEGRPALLAAGLQPGLTELLPRWVAQRDGHPRRLASWLAVLDEFTPSAASDFLHAAEHSAGGALAGWRNGERAEQTAVRRHAVSLPLLSRPVDVLPYLSPTSERLARFMDLDAGDWFTVLIGEQVKGVLDHVHGLERTDAVDALCRASRIDLAGRTRRVVLLVQLDRTDETTAVALVGRSNGELTGAITALAAKAIDTGAVHSGCHLAGEVLDPKTMIDQLISLGVVAVHELAGPVEAPVEVGEL